MVLLKETAYFVECSSLQFCCDVYCTSSMVHKYKSGTCACVRACVRACGRAGGRAGGRACVRAGVRACVSE